MRKIDNYNEVQASTGEFARPQAGGYICKIVNVTDVPYDSNTGKGDYLKIEYDFTDGELKGYYAKLNDDWGFWGGSFIRSYKEKALGMFKQFTNCLEQSNPNYNWNWDEQGLNGKLIGLVLGEEEYEKNDGSIGNRLYVKNVKTVEQIQNGDFKVPELKALPKKADEPEAIEVEDFEEVPF